jgi:hypothetical protein
MEKTLYQKSMEDTIRYFKENPERMNIKVPYDEIIEENLNSKKYHGDLIDLITLNRWRLEDEANMEFEAGRAYSPSASKEKARTMDNLAVLKGFDAKYDKILPKFKSYLKGACAN